MSESIRFCNQNCGGMSGQYLFGIFYFYYHQLMQSRARDDIEVIFMAKDDNLEYICTSQTEDNWTQPRVKVNRKRLLISLHEFTLDTACGFNVSTFYFSKRQMRKNFFVFSTMTQWNLKIRYKDLGQFRLRWSLSRSKFGEEKILINSFEW